MGTDRFPPALTEALQARWKEAGPSRGGAPQMRCTACDGAHAGGTCLTAAKTKMVFHTAVQCQEMINSTSEEDQELRRQLAPYLGPSLLRSDKDRAIVNELLGLAGTDAEAGNSGRMAVEKVGTNALLEVLAHAGPLPTGKPTLRLLRCDSGEGLEAMLRMMGTMGLVELRQRRHAIAYWEKLRGALMDAYPERKVPTPETLRKHYQTAETVWSEGRKADQALCSGTELEPGRVSQLAEAKAKAETVFTPNAKQLFAAIQQALAQGADELSAGAVAGVPVPRPTPGTAAATARPAPPNSPATERTFELEARKAKLEAKARRRAQREEKHKEEQEWKRAKREMAKRKDEALLEALQSVQAQNAAISSLLQKMADKFM